MAHNTSIYTLFWYLILAKFAHVIAVRFSRFGMFEKGSALTVLQASRARETHLGEMAFGGRDQREAS
jgi:hypothetical protein